ncbi:MAG: hydrogenase maturation protease [Proteobacteria bacterium]|nr:hydrogenase maturation protease [Pseudomonadota bacterium]
MRAPVVVIAVGNPSRGDDAIGPELAERLEREALPGVDVIVDYQLQIEHSLELEGRTLAVFVDASVSAPPPCSVDVVRPERDASHSTHSLSPAALLEIYVRCTGRQPPPARVLAVRGERFELGEPLSPAARVHLEAAWAQLRDLAAGPARD